MNDGFLSAPAPRARSVMAASLSARVFCTTMKIRFSHCDPAGIVYTANYVDLMNAVVEDFFAGALGLDYYAMIRDRRVGLGFAQANCEFFRPAFMGDDLDMRLLVGRVGAGSAALRIHAHRAQDEVARGNFVLVTTNLDRHKPTPIPDDLRAGLLAYQDLCR